MARSSQVRFRYPALLMQVARQGQTGVWLLRPAWRGLYWALTELPARLEALLPEPPVVPLSALEATPAPSSPSDKSPTRSSERRRRLLQVPHSVLRPSRAGPPQLPVYDPVVNHCSIKARDFDQWPRICAWMHRCVA